MCSVNHFMNTISFSEVSEMKNIVLLKVSQFFLKCFIQSFYSCWHLNN